MQAERRRAGRAIRRQRQLIRRFIAFGEVAGLDIMPWQARLFATYAAGRQLELHRGRKA